jgi:SAM-dependent methyltransferase
VYASDVAQELITLMRGFFSMPVISTLAKRGVVDQMLAAERFRAADLTGIRNTQALCQSLRYLARLGLLRSCESPQDSFELTPLGRDALRRSSSFFVPHSYLEYMHSYERLLEDSSLDLSASVDRLENVIGSGLTHQRYFVPALSHLRRRLRFEVVVDLGCGGGHFLRELVKAIPGTAVVGVDLSPVSLRAAEESLGSESDVTTVCADAFDVDEWSIPAHAAAGNRAVAITMWFLVHEVSRGDVDRVVRFFERIHASFPHAPIVLGELVRLPESVLAHHHQVSVMPEYLFFHELSGQGILSWEEYEQVLQRIPYTRSFEKTFDDLKDDHGRYLPSAFVWGLTPVPQ